MINKNSFLIFGAGHLGKIVAQRLRDQNHDVTEVRSNTSLNFPKQSFDSVIYLIPPKGNSVDQKLIQTASEFWNKKKHFIHISSTGVYSDSSDPLQQVVQIDENTPVAAKSSRTELLLSIEDHVRDTGGFSIRMTGLYDENKGPHRAYSNKPVDDLNPSQLVNLIHYDDAADLTVTASLHSSLPDFIPIGVAMSGITRRKIAEHFGLNLNWGKDLGHHGRIITNDITRSFYGWKPLAFGQNSISGF